MEEYMKLFKEHIGEDRQTFTKTMFKIMSAIYRGVNNNRFTVEQALNKLGGAN